MVEETCAHVQRESLKAHAALLRRLINSPITHVFTPVYREDSMDTLGWTSHKVEKMTENQLLNDQSGLRWTALDSAQSAPGSAGSIREVALRVADLTSMGNSANRFFLFWR